MTLTEFKREHKIVLHVEHHCRQSLPEPHDEYWEVSLQHKGWVVTVHKRYPNRWISSLAMGYGKTKKKAIEALVSHIKGHELALCGMGGVVQTSQVPIDLTIE